MNSLGWSRRDPAVPATGTASQKPLLDRLQSFNPFGEGGVRLPTYENEGPGAPLPARTRREEEEGWFARTYLHLLENISARQQQYRKVSPHLLHSIDDVLRGLDFICLR